MKYANVAALKTKPAFPTTISLVQRHLLRGRMLRQQFAGGAFRDHKARVVQCVRKIRFTREGGGARA